jgi:LPXTG-site transpeptidase (sortase) family protein
MKRNVRVTIFVLIIFVGVCILGSTYYNTKKYEVFDDMNEKYYEEIGSLIESEDVINTTDSDNNSGTNVDSNKATNETVTTTTTTTTTIKTTTIESKNIYIGYLNIPKINLQRGFTDINSKYNKVSKNIYVHPSSSYPDKENGNLILASHSGTSSISFFKNLYKLELNDDVYVNYNNKDYHYKVTDIYTDVKDGDIGIRRNKNKTTLTLITCTKNDKTTQTVYICELTD